MAKNDNKGKGSSLGYLGRMVGLNVLIVAAIAVAMLVGVSLWLGSYTRHDERITLPDLSGFNSDDAGAQLDRLGLKWLVVDSVYAGSRPGSVVDQIPVAGLPVKKGRIVYLTINAMCPKMVRLSEVREGASRQAFSTLRSLGFVVDSVRQVASEMHDLVLDITCNGVPMTAGKEYPEGTHVVLHVGNANMVLEPENDENEEDFFN